MTGFHTYTQNGIPIGIDLSTLPEVFDELARIDAELATMRSQVAHLIIAYETRIRELENRLQGDERVPSDPQASTFRFPECMHELRQSTFENLDKLSMRPFYPSKQEFSTRSDEEGVFSECDKENDEESGKKLH